MTGHWDEAGLAAWWCANISRFRDEADEFGWRPVLDAAESELRAGLPFKEVLARLHLPVPAQSGDTGQRSLVSLDGLGIPSIPVAGVYTCPREHPCRRTAEAHPDTGAEPRCDMADLPMRYRPRRGRA